MADDEAAPPPPADSFPDKADGEYSEVPTSNHRGVYTGTVRDHRMNGMGKLQTPLGVFSGCFTDDELEGDGVYSADPSPEATAAGGSGDGAAVAGSAASMHSSLFTPLLASVREYRGGFHRTKFHGARAVMTFKNGDVYEGPCAAGLPEAADGGKYTFADGRCYEGGMKVGLRHGHGRLTQTNGDFYDGGFVAGAMTGFGTASYGDGARVFTGLWEDGAKVKGKLSFPGSDRMYEGQWLGERPHGKGTMVFANGDRYDGDFEQGMLQGVGLLTYATAPGRRYYYGQFLEDQPYGRGWLISFPEDPETAQASTIEGYFMKGQLVPAGDAAAVEQVIAATKGLPQPQSRAPIPELTEAAAAEGPAGPSAPRAAPAAQVVAAETSSSLATPPAQAAREASPGTPDHDVELSDTDADESNEVVPNDSMVGSFPPAVGSSSFAEDSCKGWLEKCSIGRSTLGLISNWKRRFFILAAFQGNVCLGYYDDELCRKPIGFLRLSTDDTRIVTRPSSRTHKKASKPGRELCVIYHEHRKTFKLLLRAPDAAEHDRWVAAFLRYFSIVDRPTDFPLPVK